MDCLEADKRKLTWAAGEQWDVEVVPCSYQEGSEGLVTALLSPGGPFPFLLPALAHTGWGGAMQSDER